MNRTIYVIGTSHLYQHLSKDISDDAHISFRGLIKTIIEKYDISMVAEESNTEALEENGIPESALQLIAKELRVKHLFTEASRSYRSKNGMEQENDIRISGLMNDQDEQEIEKRIQDSYRTRERYWLNLIAVEDVWPVLHVCGANHAAEFSKLVITHNFKCELLYEDWDN